MPSDDHLHEHMFIRYSRPEVRSHAHRKHSESCRPNEQTNKHACMYVCMHVVVRGSAIENNRTAGQLPQSIVSNLVHTQSAVFDSFRE